MFAVARASQIQKRNGTSPSVDLIPLGIPPCCLFFLCSVDFPSHTHTIYAPSRQHKISRMFKYLLAVLSLIPVSSACGSPLRIDKSSYEVGQDVVVTFPEDCDLQNDENVEHPSSSFLAIYHANSELEDIQGDANYLVWMWTCGSQLCRRENGFESDGKTPPTAVTFSVETTNGQSWPLGKGSYQVHLVQQWKGEHRFSSVARSPVFEVTETVSKPAAQTIRLGRNLRKEEQGGDTIPCPDDSTYITSWCFREEDDIYNDCLVYSEREWIAVFPFSACDSVTNICQGEPVVWARACEQKTTSCHRQYNIKAVQYSSDDEDVLVLKAGDYQVAVVTAGDHGDVVGYHHGNFLSERLSVVSSDQSCHVTERQS